MDKMKAIIEERMNIINKVMFAGVFIGWMIFAVYAVLPALDRWSACAALYVAFAP